MKSLTGTTHRRRIYLLRHGAADRLEPHGKTGDDAHGGRLSATGRAQAALLAKWLGTIEFDRVVHTDLARTRETVEIVLGSERGRSLEAARELRSTHIDQEASQRSATGLTDGFETPARAHGKLAHGEPCGAFYERVVAGFERLLRQPGWSRLLLVAHGRTNRVILAWMIRGGLDCVATFEQDEGCLNVLDVDVVDGEALRRYIRVVNLTSANLSKEALKYMHDRAA